MLARLSRRTNAFLSFDKDAALSVLLSCIIFSIAFSGLGSLVASAMFVMLLELLFILSFLFLFHHYPAFRILKTKNLRLMQLSIFWCLCVVLSLLLNNQGGFQQQAAVARLITLFVHVVFCWSLANYFLLSQISLDRYMASACFSVLLLIAIYVFTYLFGVQADSASWFERPPFAVHIRHIGSLTSVVAVVALSYLLFAAQQLRVIRYGVFIASILFFAFLWWMGGRGATFAVLLCCLLSVVYLCRYFISLKKNILVVLLSLMFAVLLADAFKVFDWNGMARVSSEVVQSSQSAGLDLNHYSTGRVNIWAVALEAANKSPWLGLGPNGYLFIEDRPYGIQPHNLFIQFYVEWGVLGGGAFVLLLLLALYSGARVLFFKPQELPIVYFVAAMIILSLSLLGLLDGTYFHSQPVFYLALAFAIFPYNLSACKKSLTLKAQCS